MTNFEQIQISGAGVGLRSQHYRKILQDKPEINWFEALTENYFGGGGLPHYYLEKVRAEYPITLHGVGMSLGSTSPPDAGYLAKLKRLIKRYEPVYVSDHLAWVSANGRFVHDLVPLPYTEEALTNFVNHVIQAQDYLGRNLLIENPASYLSYNCSAMSEWDFLLEVVARTGCDLLIDVNNIHVSAVNLGFDARKYIQAIPRDRVKEIHLAGYENHKEYLLDTHGQRVHSPVWELYKFALQRFGPVPTLIEWDTDIPDFEVLMEEAEKADVLIRAHR